MFVRFTTRKNEIRNFKKHQTNWIDKSRNQETNRVKNFKNRKINFRCYKYRLFRCNFFMRYLEIQFVLRNREFFATISTMSTSISWIKFVDFIIRFFTWFCIDLIQTTTKWKWNRQKFKRVIRNFDHCIFCEIFFKIRNFCFEFVCFSFFVSISFLFQMFRIFFVVDTFVTTYSNRLSKSRLQTMRRDFRIEQQILRTRSSISCEISRTRSSTLCEKNN